MKKMIDKALTPMCYVLRHFKRAKTMPSISEIGSILIIRIGGMGDAVALLPLIRQLSDGGIKVSVLATPETSKIFERCSAVSEILIWETKPAKIMPSFIKLVAKLRGSHYDLVVDTEQFARVSAVFSFLPQSKYVIGFAGHGGKEDLYNEAVPFDDQKHITRTFADLFEDFKLVAPETYERLNILNDPADSDFPARKDGLTQMVEDDNAKGIKWLGFHVGTGNTATQRRWSPKRYAELINKLAENPNRRFFIIGTSTEKAEIEEVRQNLGAKSIPVCEYFVDRDFDSLLSLLSHLDLLVANDSGIMHLGASMECPVIGLFGANLPLRWSSLGANVKNIYHQQPCSPCIQTHKGIVPSKCKMGTNKCMEDISVDEVFSEAERMLI